MLHGTYFTRGVLSRDPAVTAGFAVNTLVVIELYIFPSVDYEILFSLEQTHLSGPDKSCLESNWSAAVTPALWFKMAIASMYISRSLFYNLIQWFMFCNHKMQQQCFLLITDWHRFVQDYVTLRLKNYSRVQPMRHELPHYPTDHSKSRFDSFEKREHRHRPKSHSYNNSPLFAVWANASFIKHYNTYQNA